MKSLTQLMFLTTFTFFLASCLSPQERAENQARYDAAQQEFQAGYVAELQAKCDGYGFRRGTDAFAACMQKENNDAQAANQASREKALREVRRISCQLGNSYDCDTVITRPR